MPKELGEVSTVSAAFQESASNVVVSDAVVVNRAERLRTNSTRILCGSVRREGGNLCLIPVLLLPAIIGGFVLGNLSAKDEKYDPFEYVPTNPQTVGYVAAGCLAVLCVLILAKSCTDIVLTGVMPARDLHRATDVEGGNLYRVTTESQNRSL